MNKVSVVCVSLIAALLVATHQSTCSAAIIYSFTFDRDEYVVPAGESVDVVVLFQEITDGGSVGRLAAGGNDGLFAAGFVLDYGGGDAVADLLRFDLRNGANEFNSGFTTNVDDRAARTFQLDSQANNAQFGIETSSFLDAGRNVFEVPIASFELLNTGTSDSTTTLTLQPTPTPFGLLFADFFEPDEMSVTYGTATFRTVTAVPEPGSCMLIAIATAVTCRYRRRFAK